eukprot:m.96394 g.96394  ORF g.96394 m.96394 type:complete len:406 (+) comp8966_c0_seq5:136-1353(+)
MPSKRVKEELNAPNFHPSPWFDWVLGFASICLGILVGVMKFVVVDLGLSLVRRVSISKKEMVAKDEQQVRIRHVSGQPQEAESRRTSLPSISASHKGISNGVYSVDDKDGLAEVIVLNSKQTVWDNEVKRVIVMIPGNPGNPKFYTEYMTEIHERLKVPCVVLGHTGQSFLSKGKATFSHFHQVEHKVKLMKLVQTRYPSAKFILVGHSIGAWIGTEMLRSLNQDDVSLVINLFPTVHHIGTTPNGKRLYPLLRHLRNPIAELFGILGRLLPSVVLEAMVTWHLKRGKETDPSKCCVEAACSLTYPEVALQAFYMGCCELEYMRDIDHLHYQNHEEKLVWYYGENDEWLTPHHVDDIMRMLPKSTHVHCKKGFSHDFVVHDSIHMAKLTCELMDEYYAKTATKQI